MTVDATGKDEIKETKIGGAKPDVTGLDPQKQQEIILQYIVDRFESGKKLEKTTQEALIDAINRAKNTQEWILRLNIAMFIFGILLICAAVAVSYSKDNASYSILFGGVGFLQIVASFFIGAMTRSQNAVSDLVQVEIAYLNYFEQVTLWEQYASIMDDANKIDKANIEKAADKIQTCTKETLELLQINIEETGKSIKSS
jgi:hypothetical protein